MRHGGIPEDTPNYEVVEIPESQAGESFSSASGDLLPNLGSTQVPAVTRELTQRLLSITACPVSKPAQDFWQ